MIKIAVCQMGASGSAQENLATITRMIEKAVHDGGKLDLICFPEYCYFLPSQQSATQQPETIPGHFSNTISQLAKKHHVNILAGSFPEKADNGRILNTSLFFNRDGKIIGRYSKVHLMVALGCDESIRVEPGDHIEVFDADFGRVGLMVCYDMRFPEHARSMVLDGADVLLVPSEFPSGNPLPPRTDHWDCLVQSTALLNLTYTVAINQYGQVFQSIPFGRSCVVDPWGTVISQASNREDIIYTELDLEFQKKIRASVATWENRRPDIYKL